MARLDELDGYLRELREIAPTNFEEYQRIEKKRACERLLQIAVESVLDICSLIVAGLRLGLPAEEDDLFEKMEQAGIITTAMHETLKEMKGFRNILVHEYGRVDDRIIFDLLKSRLRDFENFRFRTLQVLKRKGYLHEG